MVRKTYAHYESFQKVAVKKRPLERVFFLRTKWGSFQIKENSKGILAIKLPNQKNVRSHAKSVYGSSKFECQLRRYFYLYMKGLKCRRISVQIDESVLSLSQRRMMRALAAIPTGEVRTYGWLAKKCGMPRGLQATGQMLRSNPLPILIPCHRIVRQNGELGGFNGGATWKRRLLEHEHALALRTDA